MFHHPTPSIIPNPPKINRLRGGKIILDTNPLIRYLAYMKHYTTGEVMKFLREKVAGRKTQKEIARELGVTPQYLSDILGENRRLTPEVAAALGFRKLPDAYVRSKPEVA